MGGKVYFASDFHLGSFPLSDSRTRERLAVAWLDAIKADARELFLVGDVFDFWFEYATVVPKGYVRFLGKLAELADAGVKITLFKGNHDMWMSGYLKDELGAAIVDNELVIDLGGKSFYIHHGDGLGAGDRRYKMLKKIFRSRFCQWLFARLHPNIGIGIAQKWSRHSRAANGAEELFLGEEREWLVQYAKDVLKDRHYDHFVFGHRHLPYDLPLGENSRIINLGEWMRTFTYAVWDGQALHLKKFPHPERETI